MQKNKAAHRAICSDIVFTITYEKSPSFIINKYKLGRFGTGILYLNPYECMFLYTKGKIVPENTSLNNTGILLERLGSDENFLDEFIVYEILKSHGLYVKFEGSSLYYRRTPRDDFKGPVRVIREDHTMDFSVMFNNGSCIYAALDDDNDVTVFISEPWNETGENDFVIERGKNIRNLFRTPIAETSEVPEWFGNYIGGVKFLNQYEAAILSENGPDRKTDQEIVQKVYNDLISRKFIVKTGFKYGSNFRIYSRTIEEHADFLVHVLDGPEEWYKISRGIRVAQGVKKEMIFAGKIGDRLEYIKLKRVRDPFSADF